MHRPCSTDSQTRCWPSPRGAAAGDVIHTRVSPTPIHPRSHQSDHLRFSLPMIHWKAHSRPSLIWAHQEKLSLGWLVYPVWAAHDFFFSFCKRKCCARAEACEPHTAHQRDRNSASTCLLFLWEILMSLSLWCKHYMLFSKKLPHKKVLSSSYELRFEN